MRVFVAVLVVALFLGHTADSAALPKGNDQPAAQNTVVALRLTVSGRTATVKIPDKGCGSVTVESQPTIRFYAEVNGDSVDLADWQVAGENDACSVPATARRTKLFVKGSTQVAVGDMGIVVELVSFSVAPVTTGGQGPCKDCCVVCQGLTFCGCEVETACGRCCCSDTCGCQLDLIAQR